MADTIRIDIDAYEILDKRRKEMKKKIPGTSFSDVIRYLEHEKNK